MRKHEMLGLSKASVREILRATVEYMRPSFPDVYMRLAVDLAERSTCQRGLKVGAVITSPNYRKVIAVGYNGNASGLPNACDRTGPEAIGNCGCIHAEANAVVNCDVARETKKIVFVTHLPCAACAKLIVNLGSVEGVYYLNDYRVRDGAEILKKTRIPVGHFAYGKSLEEAREKTWHDDFEKDPTLSPEQRDVLAKTAHLREEHTRRLGR